MEQFTKTGFEQSLRDGYTVEFQNEAGFNVSMKMINDEVYARYNSLNWGYSMIYTIEAAVSLIYKNRERLED